MRSLLSVAELMDIGEIHHGAGEVGPLASRSVSLQLAGASFKGDCGDPEMRKVLAQTQVAAQVEARSLPTCPWHAIGRDEMHAMARARALRSLGSVTASSSFWIQRRSRSSLRRPRASGEWRTLHRRRQRKQRWQEASRSSHLEHRHHRFGVRVGCSDAEGDGRRRRGHGRGDPAARSYCQR